MVQGDAPHSPPFGLINSLSHISDNIAATDARAWLGSSSANDCLHVLVREICSSVNGD